MVNCIYFEDKSFIINGIIKKSLDKNEISLENAYKIGHVKGYGFST